MCQTLEIITSLFFFTNFCTVIYAAARHRRPTRLRDFWLSLFMFIAVGTLMYFHIVSDCPMSYIKAAAAFLALNFIILIFDVQVWLPT